MKTWKTTIVIICAALLIMTSILLIFLSTASTLLSPSFYTDSLESSGTFDYIDENLEKIPETSFIKFPDNSSEELFEELITNFLEYIRGDSETLDLNASVDTSKVKDFFITRVEQLPVCQSEQISSQDSLEGICRPQNQTSEEFLDEFLERNNITILDKDTIDLKEIYDLKKGSEGRETLDNIRNAVSYYWLAVGLIAILSMTLVFLIIIISPTKSGLKLAGISITIASIITFMIVTITSFSIQNYIPQVNPLLNSIITAFADELIVRLYISSLIAFTAGIILFIISFFIKKPKRQPS